MVASANELSYFLELANTLNISRASERIGISQPSLSLALKRLEKNLGTKVFLRTKKGLVLTPAGKQFLLRAKQMAQLWETAKSTCLAAHDSVQGSLIFGCHAAIASQALMHVLANLLVDYPQLELNFKHDLSRKVLENVINFSVDFALVVNPVRHPDLIIRKLYDDKVTLWGPRKYSLDCLKADATIIADPELMQTQFILKALQKQNYKYKRLIASSDFDFITGLVEKGVGWGILPTTVAQSRLKPVTKAPYFSDEICYAYRYENQGVRVFVEIAKRLKKYFEGT